METQRAVDSQRWARVARNVGLGLSLAIIVAIAVGSLVGGDAFASILYLTAEMVVPAIGLILFGCAFLTNRLWLRWPLAILGGLLLLSWFAGIVTRAAPGY